MSHKPLTPDQHRAADMLGQGFSKTEVAEEFGVSLTAIRRWLKRDDFKALVKRANEAVLEENPSARSRLEAALNATNSRGQPLWPIQLKAAELLMRDSDPTGNGDGSGVRETVIYMPPEN